MAKLKVEVKTGKEGQKVAEVKPKVMVAQSSGKPKGKPIYRSRAKLTTHLTINGKRRA